MPNGTPLKVTPLEVGEVDSLADELLKASLTLPTSGRFRASYEIQLALQPSTGQPDWTSPIWTARAQPAENPAIDEDDDVPPGPSPAIPVAPHFETLDSAPAVNGMRIDSQTPDVRLSTEEPIDRFRWRLRQDDERVDFGDDVTTGITDGTCIRFRSNVQLRRGRPGVVAKLKEGEFQLPVMAGIPYNTRTYPGHSNFAVDFNRDDRQDDGEWVLACARGKVQFVDKGSRTDPVNGPPSHVYIGHKGRWQTLYVHMDHIQVRKGDRVEPGQKVGRVSDVGAPFGRHLHLQVRRRASPSVGVFDGTPMKMTLGGMKMTASVDDSDFRPAKWGTHFGQRVTGAAQPSHQVRPEFRVAVRRASDGAWSGYRKLEFFVSRTGNEVPDAVDPGCGTVGALRGLAISHSYDGPRLAPGKYSVRYRVMDDLGNDSAWAVDRSIVVTGGDDD